MTRSKLTNNNQNVFLLPPAFRSWIAVARAYHIMQKTLAREITHLGIKPSHLEILCSLYYSEGTSQQALARQLLVGRSNISMLLPQLGKVGLVDRRADGKDKRVIRLYLTSAGRSVTEEAIRIHSNLAETFFRSIDLEVNHIVTEAMERLASDFLGDPSHQGRRR